MLIVTLGCIVYFAYRIQSPLLFFEIAENPIFKTIVNVFHEVKWKEPPYSQQLQSKTNTIWNLIDSIS